MDAPRKTGDYKVRVIYSDETGIGSITDEPYAVVAAIASDGLAPFLISP
jgi:hypothetical protein